MHRCSKMVAEPATKVGHNRQRRYPSIDATPEFFFFFFFWICINSTSIHVELGQFGQNWVVLAGDQNGLKRPKKAKIGLESSQNQLWGTNFPPQRFYLMCECMCMCVCVREREREREMPFNSTPRKKISFFEPSLATPISLVAMPITVSFASYKI